MYQNALTESAIGKQCLGLQKNPLPIKESLVEFVKRKHLSNGYKRCATSFLQLYKLWYTYYQKSTTFKELAQGHMSYKSLSISILNVYCY